jgi:hypothetical protein
MVASGRKMVQERLLRIMPACFHIETHDTGIGYETPAGPLLRYLTACLLKPMGTRQVT